MNILTFKYPHPVKSLVSREVARLWPADNCRLTRKYDGQFCQREVAGHTLLGELVKAKSGGFFTQQDRALMALHGEFFAAWDCVAVHGQSIAAEPTRVRERYLENALVANIDNFDGSMVVYAETVVDIDKTFADGGEGIVRNEWTAPYGQITVCKVAQIYVCRVSSIGGTQSVGIVDAETGLDRGRLTLSGGAVDKVRVGSIVRCEAMGEHDGGKLRQVTKCREWLVQF